MEYLKTGYEAYKKGKKTYNQGKKVSDKVVNPLLENYLHEKYKHRDPKTYHEEYVEGEKIKYYDPDFEDYLIGYYNVAQTHITGKQLPGHFIGLGENHDDIAIGRDEALGEMHDRDNVHYTKYDADADKWLKHMSYKTPQGAGGHGLHYIKEKFMPHVNKKIKTGKYIY